MHTPTLLASLAVLLLAVLALPAADWPAPDKLPVRDEMPDPLVFFNGEKVTTKDQWQKRREELKDLFQHYMYGTFPRVVPVTATILHVNDQFLDGKATLKEVQLSFGPANCPKINLLVVLPNGRKEPVPCFVGPNFSGNHTLVDDALVAIPRGWMYPGQPGVKENRATEDGRGKAKDVWAIDQTIARGYGVATFYAGDAVPDQANLWTESIRPYFLPANRDKPGPSDWATIAAWAYTVSRCVDFLTTDKGVDASKIVAVGHSRLGKTVLLAAAFDERIALAIPHQAGCGGSAPSRGTAGQPGKFETVARINTSFPHWFDDNFKQFNDDPRRLPFDQNGLVALCAPRPVLFTNAIEDQWANPSGQFEVLKAADGVYRLLGVEGLGAKVMPETNTLLPSRLGYWIRPGQHSMTRADWKVFLDFADKNLGK
jgi:hypothetical protein